MPTDETIVVTPYVLEGGGPPLVEAIEQRRPDLEIEHVTDEERFLELVDEVDIAVTHRLPPEALEAAEGLRWVQALSAGTDAYDHEALADRDVMLTSASGVHAKPIGQHVLTGLLYFERRFNRARSQQRDREWDRYFAGELGDRTVGIVGTGAIGSQVADYCQSFGSRIIGTKRDPTDAPESLDAVYSPDELEVVLGDSDYLVLACPLTEETRGLIDAEALATLPDDAVLVNIARGEIVDQSALVTALEDDGLRGAALDVFEEEPLPDESPLWDRDDVLLTPHVAGVTPHYWERCADIFLRNYDRFRSGDDLENRVV
ncbi:D-2-hydroxyacid dehydrogenase [Salinadaptatus halalkaliphilus]|uniref:D-2-hydroxyacid dehydrogenase n=1 Tax=Salinadaptatus halalkaliphilus TaxID=2419781 RepID=A0A4S3TM64_9EURY|nr:D-2-hydroxyacid dehydrogenase [Salinadaptatus halalkaliphilus]THE64353.1 D-2-hydroxyacid dehydrogenase [Salinadaptatus halalkaliphilus]